MLRRSVLSFAKVHGTGRVFWRTKQESPVDRGMKVPLLTERPFPLAEVVRRMVRIRCKYDDSDDTAERALLRGEYKYYTGKTCDLRSATTADMVAVVECCGFFGFWDNKLLRLVELRLIDHVMQLEPLELMLLFRSLPKVRMTGSDLYLDVCDRLAGLSDAGDLTPDEIVSIVASAEAETPMHILRHMLLNHLRVHVERVDLTPEDALSVLRGVTMLDPATGPGAEDEEAQLRQLARRVVAQLLDGVETLTASEIGEATHYLGLLGAIDVEAATPTTDRTIKRLIDAFCAKLHGCDAGALSSMIDAVSAVDPTFVIRVSTEIMDKADEYSPQEHVSVFTAAVATANLAVKDAAAGGGESAVDLLKDLLEVHAEGVTNTSYAPDARNLLKSAETLAVMDARLRKLSPQFYPTSQQVLGSLAAHAGQLTASECVAALSAATSLGAAATDAVLDSYLRWLLAAATAMSPGDVSPVLRAAQSLPPLPTSRSRARMVHEVLPKLLDRADGLGGRPDHRHS